jgi:hypothetical protein
MHARTQARTHTTLVLAVKRQSHVRKKQPLDIPRLDVYTASLRTPSTLLPTQTSIFHLITNYLKSSFRVLTAFKLEAYNEITSLDLQVRKHNAPNQGSTNPGRHIAVATEFCTVAPNGCEPQNRTCFMSPLCHLEFWRDPRCLGNLCTLDPKHFLLEIFSNHNS